MCHASILNKNSRCIGLNQILQVACSILHWIVLNGSKQPVSASARPKKRQSLNVLTFSAFLKWHPYSNNSSLHLDMRRALPRGCPKHDVTSHTSPQGKAVTTTKISRTTSPAIQMEGEMDHTIHLPKPSQFRDRQADMQAENGRTAETSKASTTRHKSYTHTT